MRTLSSESMTSVRSLCVLMPLAFVLRLLEIVHADQKLYLVFEFLDMDLKRFMDRGNACGTPISPELVKARVISFRRPEHCSPPWNFRILRKIPQNTPPARFCTVSRDVTNIARRLSHSFYFLHIICTALVLVVT